MEAAVDSGDGSPSTWQPASRIALSAENSSLLEVQFTGTLRASVLIQVVAGEFVRMMLVAVDDKIQQVRFGRFALQMPRGGNGRCQNGFPMAPCDYLPHASDNHSAAILHQSRKAGGKSKHRSPAGERMLPITLAQLRACAPCCRRACALPRPMDGRR